jgi:hypothetical protein
MNQPNTDTDTITATVEFSFRGEHCKLVAQLGVAYLTELLESGDEGVIHRVIANKSGLDTYSYAYEVMEMQPIHFSDAQGLIGNFIEDGALDTQAYLQAWREVSPSVTQVTLQPRERTLLEQIVREHLQIESLDDYPELHKVLEAAYQAGKQARN